MSKAVKLYLASGVSNGVGFWLVNFTDNDDIINCADSKILECYRMELFGLYAAISVKDAINSTLDILVSDCHYEGYKLDNFNEGFSSEIPLDIIEDIFDLWAYNYYDDILWKKCIGLLKLRKKLKRKNNFINIGLKGKIYNFSVKLEQLLSYRPNNSLNQIKKSNELMW